MSRVSSQVSSRVSSRFPGAAVAAAVAVAALSVAAPCALAQDANLARNLAATCANCHGAGGQSRGEVKSLAGLPAESIVAAFNGYKAGTLPATVMHQIAKGYSDEQVKLIAGFLAAQQPSKK